MGKATKSQPRQSYGAADATNEGGFVIDGATGLPVPPTPAKREKFIPLSTLDDVKVELARLYRQTKAGKVETADASRLAFILNSLGRVIVDAELEQRIAALEQSTDERE
jgi:hypothetical protein